MRNAQHLTTGHDPIFARQVEKTRAGMASWAAGGPFGATCGECAHYGYHEQIRNAAGDTVKTKFRQKCCAMFHRLTQRHGPPVPPNTEACRHFKRREQESAR
jgi:hypothetical protein